MSDHGFEQQNTDSETEILAGDKDVEEGETQHLESSSNTSDLKASDPPVTFSPGCFAPGTLVWTKQEQIPIEALKENDAILTQAGNQFCEYGLKSDEIVAIPVENGEITLYSFNGETPFFTKDQVFRTTTGHRAIDPISAKRENPWLEVGQLRQGHVLMHTQDALSYKLVVIDNIAEGSIKCDHVWSMHLREGLRQYHANGYLVRINYPEITIKSIANSIRALPKDQAMQMLHHIKELKPIFDRFGCGAVEQLLYRELGDDELLQSMRHKEPDELPPQPLFFQSRSYIATTDEDLPQEYNLPPFDCIDGILYIGSGICQRSRILERGFHWSRLVVESQNLWEHGICTFGEDRNLLTGDGLIWLLKDANPTTADTKPFRFQVQSTSLRSRYLDITPTYKAIMTHDSHSIEVTTSYQKTHSQTTSIDESTDFEKLLKSERPQEHFDPDSNYKKIATLADKFDGLLPRAQENMKREADRTYDLQYENPDADAKVSGGFVSFMSKIWSSTKFSGLFRITREQTGNQNDVKSLSFRIPDLDRLAEYISKRSKEKPRPYYRTQYVPTQGSNFEVLVEMIEPEALAMTANDNVELQEGQPKVKSWKDLSFRTAHSNFSLPFIFKKFRFSVNDQSGLIEGVIAEYEPHSESAIGYEGTRHVVKGTIVKAEPNQSVTEKGSVSAVEIASRRNEPAPITQNSEAINIKSVSNLVTGLGINPGGLKEYARDLIHLTMLYHMDGQEREGILHADKPPLFDQNNTPKGLPENMGPKLPSELRDWIEKEYSVAYIANKLSMYSSAEQRSHGAKFTNDDIKKLRYWWHGQGPHCLNRSPEWNRLNTIAANETFNCRYGDKIHAYRDDAEEADVPNEKCVTVKAQGGQKWAYLYYYQVSREDIIQQMASELQWIEYTNNNPLDYHCTLLEALWPDEAGNTGTGGKELGRLLTGIINRRLKEHKFNYEVEQSPDEVQDGLTEHVSTFFDILLDDKKAAKIGIKQEVREK
ncbi:hypothetical protein ABW20_dc0105753 [Dactylellina cionopaga]|nr:hypothetical protein ABW20_dc0105753 [Dactylellina cionopaga]